MRRLPGIVVRWLAWWGFWVAVCAIGMDQAWVFSKVGDPPPHYHWFEPIACWSTMIYLILPVAWLRPTATDAGGAAWMTFCDGWAAVFALLTVLAAERLYPRRAARVTTVVLGGVVLALVGLRLVAMIPPTERTSDAVMIISGIGLALFVLALQIQVLVGLAVMVLIPLSRRLRPGRPTEP